MNIIFDPNFYIALSFFTLIGFALLKFKGKSQFYLQKRIDSISADLNQAACEKDEALLAYTRASTNLAQLPDDIAKIWKEAPSDLSGLETKLALDVEKEAALNAARLAHWKKQLIQKEYTQDLDRLAEQFQRDVLAATSAQKEALIDQSLDLLEGIAPRGGTSPFS